MGSNSIVAPGAVVLKDKCSKKIRKILRKTTVLKSPF